MRARATVFSALFTVVGLLGACGGSSGGSDITGHSRLIDELAEQVDNAGDRAYTAEYLLGGEGEIATIARQATPEQVAFLFPDGRYVVTADYEMWCTPAEETECVVHPASEPTLSPPGGVLEKLGGEQFLSAQTVIGWLTEAGASSSANITSKTRTIAGEHATCITVAGAETARVTDFEACVTDAGLLGSFTGSVDGQPRSVVLKSVSATVEPELFEIPEDVVVIDERPSPST